MNTCTLCFHHCRLSEGQVGFCRARINRGGQIVPLNYGRITSLALDPIEKKPLRHFHPGSSILSVGSFGCNLRCPFCQNSQISMAGTEFPAETASPEMLAALAQRLVSRGNIGIAYTYNEPLVGYEFLRDCAQLVHQAGLYNVVISNGTICPEPWQELLPLIDAVNIDLKGFTEEWYRELGGDLKSVQQAIVMACGRCHVEVTTLLVPGRNDSAQEIRALAAWLASVDPEIPLHLSRFFPHYHMCDLPPTPVDTVHQRAEEARLFLRHVYTGNC